MATAESLEGMTDAGQFEILATRVLRELDADCNAVVHAGVNAQGKTIANAVDAFCLVPGSIPPRYVLVAFTLTAPDGLIGKWLFDHTTYTPTGKRRTPPRTQSDDGDLIKAGREAAAIRAQHPNAVIVVWLCSNRRLDTNLQRLVYDKGTELGVEVRFLEQSRLRDFLDMKPEGQWLRQEHLGIAADQMSGSLLRQLSQASLNRYANDFLLPPLDEIVPTQATHAAGQAIQRSATLHVLSGPSGAGKSVIAHALLRHHVDRGGTGLWIPTEVADNEASLSGAIEAVLRSIHPRAGVGAGHDALRLGTADHPLLLVFDDVNRSSAPVRLLKKLIGWSKPSSAGNGGTEHARSAVRIVCPAWDAIWYPLRHTYESMSWIGVQRVGPMARSEAVSCLRVTLREPVATFTDDELKSFAERLHDDPILLALFGQLLRAAPYSNPLVVAENVIGRFVEQAIGELVAANHALPANYANALNRLAAEMIRKKVLYPLWSEVERWFQAEAETRTRLGELAAQGHVCRLTSAAGMSRLEFRHDRIKEYQVSLAASEILSGQGEDRAAPIDPFFTPFVGRAIALTELSSEALDLIQQLNPAALVAAVPYLTTAPSTYADSVSRRARSWLGQATKFPESMYDDAVWTLAGTTSPRVLDVTEAIPWNQHVREARLRNGDALAGALALSAEFLPATRYAWLESLIDEARTHHGRRLTDQLRALFRSTAIDDQRRCGALCLAGYLGDPELAADVKSAWENADSQEEVLLSALWAGFRCTADNPAELVGPLLSQILTLRHDESGNGWDERGDLLQLLSFAGRHGFRAPVLTYVADLGKRREEFRWIAAAILEDIDHPVAIEYIARLLAEEQHKADESGGLSTWSFMWRHRITRRGKGPEGRLSPDSVSILRALWTAEQNPVWLQRFVFPIWAKHVQDDAELAAVPTENPHYESAVWQRAMKGDRTVVPYVLTKLAHGLSWFPVIPRIWGPELEAAVDGILHRLAGDPRSRAIPRSDWFYYVGDLLRDIPTEATERLLARHWDGLGLSPLMIQTALYHGTARCHDLVAMSLSRFGRNEDPFKRITSFFGFDTQGLMDRLTERHLNNLLPYLGLLHDTCLGKVTAFCQQFDHWAWARRHVEPELRRRAAFVTPNSNEGSSKARPAVQSWFPTDQELVAELDQLESIDRRHRPWRMSKWWEGFRKRDEPDGRASGMLLAWLASNPSPSRFVAAAELVSEQGKRRDLESLLKLMPTIDDPNLIRVAADTEFAVKRRSLD